MTDFTKPALGNAGKMRAWRDVDLSHAIPDGTAHLTVAAWGVAVFVILAVTAWCWLGTARAGGVAAIANVPQSKAIAIVSQSGEVQIDWDAVNDHVNNPNNKDATTLAIARALVAVRDGSWKPMK